MEIAHGETLPRVDIDKLSDRTRLHEFVCGNGPFEAGNGQVTIGLDHCDTPQAQRRGTRSIMARGEECLLYMILWVDAMEPRKDIPGVRQGLMRRVFQ
jgi:hypothetical protein